MKRCSDDVGVGCEGESGSRRLEVSKRLSGCRQTRSGGHLPRLPTAVRYSARSVISMQRVRMLVLESWEEGWEAGYRVGLVDQSS